MGALDGSRSQLLAKRFSRHLAPYTDVCSYTSSQTSACCPFSGQYIPETNIRFKPCLENKHFRVFRQSIFFIHFSAIRILTFFRIDIHLTLYWKSFLIIVNSNNYCTLTFTRYSKSGKTVMDLERGNSRVGSVLECDSVLVIISYARTQSVTMVTLSL